MKVLSDEYQEKAIQLVKTESAYFSINTHKATTKNIEKSESFQANEKHSCIH